MARRLHRRGRSSARLPFVAEAFHIDDDAYLVARRIAGIPGGPIDLHGFYAHTPRDVPFALTHRPELPIDSEVWIAAGVSPRR